MFYQCMSVPINTSTSMSVILIVGFLLSIMLKGRLLWIMHIVTFSMINLIFTLQAWHPDLGFFDRKNEMLTIAVTYSILYFILTYATAVLKSSYDYAHSYLHDANLELQQKANEIEAQNEELVQTQNNLSSLNNELERTEKLREKTDKLIRYSYSNAHHLRGPVARLLGLVAVYKLDAHADSAFFFDKIQAQAVEIDTVVKQINLELEAGDISDRI